MLDPSECIGQDYIRGEGRTFKVLRGPADRPREWNVYYDDGRIVRYKAGYRSGHVSSGLCGPDGEPLKPFAPPIGYGGDLIDLIDYPAPFHDSTD